MKQQCPLANVWLTWLGLPLLATVVGIIQAWWAGVVVLGVGVVAQVVYVRTFPRLSLLLGYGSVDDAPAASFPPSVSPSSVIFYTANVCPFCPIVRERLFALQRKFGFDLEEIDVTFQSRLVREKGFRSVPVVEVDGRYWVGNGTSADLAAFLAGNS